MTDAAYSAPTLRPVHEHATLVLVFGILSVLACGFFTGIPGMYVGWRSLREVRESHGAIEPGGLRAGFVLSIVGCVLWVLFVVVGVIVAILVARHVVPQPVPRAYVGTNT